MSKSPLVVGWREWIALPELGIASIKAKVDTGARTSALHAFNIRTEERGEKRVVKFSVHPIQGDEETVVECEGEFLERRTVRSSSGDESRRPVIRTRVSVGARNWPIELTLTRRDAMGFRLLLGRQALRSRCLVDPGGSYLTGQDHAP